MADYILSVDQGTTSTKAFLLDKKGELIPSKSQPIRQYYPEPGFVEHDAEEIFTSVLKCMADLLIEQLHRDHESKGDDDRFREGKRQASLSRHRMAVQANDRYLQARGP